MRMWRVCDKLWLLKTQENKRKKLIKTYICIFKRTHYIYIDRAEIRIRMGYGRRIEPDIEERETYSERAAASYN